ncbi:MAG: YcxB family protein [Acutalibacteraceae bacterium]
MQKTSIFDTSYLITEDDYVDFALAQRKFFRKRDNRILFKIMGILFVCIGVGTYLFIGGNIYQKICWCALIVIGLYLLFYYDVIDVSLTIAEAKRFYARNPKSMTAKQVVLTADSVSIRSENYEGDIPINYIYKIVDGKNTIIFYFDKINYCILPKRVLSEEQTERFGKFVSDLPENKYKKL